MNYKMSKIAFVEIWPNFCTTQNILKSFFLMRVTPRPKLIRVLSMPKVPNTIYAADLLEVKKKNMAIF